MYRSFFHDRAAHGSHAQPRFQGRDVRLDDVGSQPVVGILSVTSHLDQPDFCEQSQVMRHGWLRYGKLFAEMLARGTAPAGNPLEDREAPSVGECLGNAEEVVRG